MVDKKSHEKVRSNWKFSLIYPSFPSFLPPSLSPFLPPSLSPFLPPSLSPYLPTSLTPSVPPFLPLSSTPSFSLSSLSSQVIVHLAHPKDEIAIQVYAFLRALLYLGNENAQKKIGQYNHVLIQFIVFYALCTFLF